MKSRLNDGVKKINENAQNSNKVPPPFLSDGINIH